MNGMLPAAKERGRRSVIDVVGLGSVQSKLDGRAHLLNFRTLRIDLFELAHKYLILAHNDK